MVLQLRVCFSIAIKGTTAEASQYKLHIGSEEFVVNAVMKDEPFAKSLESIVKKYNAMTSATHEKRYVFFKVSLDHEQPKDAEAEAKAEIVWKNVLKIK